MHIRLIDAQSLTSHLIRTAPTSVMPSAIAAGFVHTFRQYRHADPDAILVLLWDTISAVRLTLNPSYKSNCVPRELSQVVNNDSTLEVILRKIATFLPVIQIDHPELEAKDLAFGLSRELSHQGHLVTLTSTHEAWLQCVRARVTLESFRKSGRVVDEYSLKTHTGLVTGALVGELQALIGSPSDNIRPVVSNLSKMEAVSIFAKFGTLTNFWKAADDPFFTYFELLPAALPEAREQLLLNRKLVNLSQYPVPDISLLSVLTGDFTDIELYEQFLDLNLTAMCDSFSVFTKAFEAPLTKEQVAIIQRASRNSAKAYAPLGPS